jgi:hypothetical protein
MVHPTRALPLHTLRITPANLPDAEPDNGWAVPTSESGPLDVGQPLSFGVTCRKPYRWYTCRGGRVDGRRRAAAGDQRGGWFRVEMAQSGLWTGRDGYCRSSVIVSGVGAWVSYIRAVTSRPEAAVRVATAQIAAGRP